MQLFVNLCVLLFTWTTRCSAHSTELLEVRIHEGAKAGARLTMGIEMQRKIEPLKSCFGQLETDIDWLEFRSTRGAFYLVDDLPQIDPKSVHTLTGTLHLLCTGNRMRSFQFHVHITRENRHAPEFVGGSEFTFYLPVMTPRGHTIGKLEVIDKDTVIYNSQRLLKFTSDQPLFNVYADGALLSKDDLSAQQPYKPIHFQVLAIDYGSPQLFSIANITIIPVTVSIRDLKVNVATDNYQIFEWEKPEYGVASKYRLSIKKGDVIVYEEEMESKRTTALTKVPISAGGDFTYSVAAIDMTGETPSETYQFTILHNDLNCSGECSKGGGVPLCYYGAFGRLEQFLDDAGPHCQCFHGYTGTQCDNTDTCPGEKTVEAYGGLDWTETPVNQSVSAPCPYNHDGESVLRLCAWDVNLGRAVWNTPQRTDKCLPQISVLTHLGMIGTFAEKADSTSTVHTVVRFLRKLLSVPAFSKNVSSPAHFDQKIAEEAIQVVNSVLRVNISSLKGNTTYAQEEMWSVLKEFATRLPSPFSVSSPLMGLTLRASPWLSGADNIKSMVGGSCYVKVSTVQRDNTLRSVCMQNGTLFQLVDSHNPILSLETDIPLRGSFARITFGLKPVRHNISDNYTCVYWDDSENGWSTRGIRRISTNDHGFVVCETTHLSVFGILPESMFLQGSPFLRDFGVLLPTVTSLITIVCTVFLLFLAAVQKGRTVDFPLLFFLFFVFVIHCVHLLLLIGPQIGDPFMLSPALHLVFQFCVLSVSACLCLLICALHSFLSNLKEQPTKDEELENCCSRPALTTFFGIVCPALLTFTTYYFANEYKHDLSRVFNRIDWLFLANYLCPAVIFLSLSVTVAIWNLVIGCSIRSRRRQTSERCLALSPALAASTTSLIVIASLTAIVVLFNMRENSVMATVMFCSSQITYCCAVFLLAGYLFRVRYLTEVEVDGESTRSLERKRDISRALLEHVDTKLPNYGSDISSIRSDSGHFLSSLTNNLYERQPMVSIV